MPVVVHAERPEGALLIHLRSPRVWQGRYFIGLCPICKHKFDESDPISFETKQSTVLDRPIKVSL